MFSVVRLTSNDPSSTKHNGAKLSDISFNIPRPLVRAGDIFEITSEFSASYSWYNITATDSFVLDIGTVYFTPSNYNALSLAKAVNEVWNGLMSFSRDTGKLTITYDSPITLYPTALSIRLGFGTSEQTDTTITGFFPANLNKTHSISLFTNIWTESIDSVSHSSSLLLSSPVIAPPFTFFKVTSHAPVSGKAVADLNSLRITILDRDNDVLDFNNQPWELVVFVKIISSIPKEETQQALLKTTEEEEEEKENSPDKKRKHE